MPPRPATTERHLAILDEFAEIGMVLARRLVDLPPIVGQDIGRDFEIISRAVRRSILLRHLIATGNLPSPPIPRPERDRAPDPVPSDRERSDTGTRLDPIDRLDTIGPTFEATVATIIRDIQTVLGSIHLPLEPVGAPSPPDAFCPAGATPDRPEADTADLK